jgi:chitinase
VTLFTRLSADLPVEEVARLAGEWGNDGLETDRLHGSAEAVQRIRLTLPSATSESNHAHRALPL